ncbi:polyprenyl synthetase family protein [Corynebacterium alimapuense]|uniref:Geranylgeranyl pyrophosphate synthase n=1 Tax=Corynebacterium alimapuense TaxID=1576874 RepID=A0A3M8KAK9_9CORY|nr:polyprenyl synthetase family protein [Corynebacterium alimapuense]RNE49498.1 geranylgeranyl pyrophosphate synthase [Corynebacterium alimapuense]
MTLDQIPEATTKLLAEFIHARSEQVAAIGGPVAEAVSHLESFILNGGKRIRPLYAWAGFIGGGGLTNTDEDPLAMLRAAASLEFIQACALIHDDIIDASDTRRGSPTVHRSVEARHRDAHWSGSSSHFGESVAILVGDLALVWAEDMFQDSGLSSEALARAREPWRAMRTEVIGGQLLDIALEAAASEDISAADSVNRFKTAAYTIERPLHLGAAIANAEADTISAFRGYGQDIGVAFQLRDDQLGVYGDPKLTGKPAGDDLREGKRTVLLATALRLADSSDPAAAAALRSGIGSTADPLELSHLADLIAGTGAVAEIEQRIEHLTESGLSHLATAHTSAEVTRTLTDLAIRATARRS